MKPKWRTWPAEKPGDGEDVVLVWPEEATEFGIHTGIVRFRRAPNVWFFNGSEIDFQSGDRWFYLTELLALTEG